MNSTVTHYQAAHAPLVAVLDAVPANAWTRPSTCAGWSARDVLGHRIETQRDYLTGQGLEPGAAPEMAADPAAAWRRHAERFAEVVPDDAVVATGYRDHFGPTTIGATIEQFYVWDMLVHRWDIARSTGADERMTDAELDRVEAGADGFGDALYMDGICRPGAGADTAPDRLTRVLARLGRVA